MKLTLVTPEREYKNDFTVEKISAQTEEMGEITLLENHADYVSTLGVGLLSFKGVEDQKFYLGAVSTGFVKVSSNSVLILANTLEISDEIDIARAQLARDKAEEMLKKVTSEIDFIKHSRKLERALARLSAAASKI